MTDCSLARAVAVRSGTAVEAVSCPQCALTFTPRRKDQRYCSSPCAKAATRHASRGSRLRENTQRNRRHYERAAWLAYDVARMSPEGKRAMLLALLETASGDDAQLRNILLDPALLGASWSSTLGKFYPDTKAPGALNIAKMVHAFCMAEWGCGTRDAILDDGKPARRLFRDQMGGEAGTVGHVDDNADMSDVSPPMGDNLDHLSRLETLGPAVAALRQFEETRMRPLDAEGQVRWLADHWPSGAAAPGMSDQAMADVLGIGPETVSKYRQRATRQRDALRRRASEKIPPHYR